MEPLPQKIGFLGLSRRIVVLGLLSVLVFTAGCVGLGAFVSPDNLPTGKACQVVVFWNREVVFAPDPTHNGAPTPGLAGRLYLFGPEINFPLVGDGAVVVDLYDDGPKASAGNSVLLEEWRLDKDMLKRLLKKDMMGWGYTLFLPWGTYKPEITQVHMMVRYDPPNGMPLFAPSSPLTLENPATENHTTCKMTNSQQVTKPANPPGQASGK